ncbi:hypothetical protein R6Q59_034502 [Mikania micrantha]
MAEQRRHGDDDTVVSLLKADDDDTVVSLVKADDDETFDWSVEDLLKSIGDSLLINPDQSGSEVGEHDFKDVSSGCKRRIRLQKSLVVNNCDEFDEDQDYEWDTNRLDYFNVTSFNLHGDDNLTGVSTYGGGDMSGQVVDISSNKIISVSNSDHDGDGSQLIPLYKFVDTVNGDGDEVVEKLEQERDGGEKVNGGEVVVHEKLTGGGGGLVVIRWWQKWWLFLDLWKID